MPTPPWPEHADSGLAGLCRLCFGRKMPTPHHAASRLRWPEHADSRVAGLCRSLTACRRQRPRHRARPMMSPGQTQRPPRRRPRRSTQARKPEPGAQRLSHPLPATRGARGSRPWRCAAAWRYDVPYAVHRRAPACSGVAHAHCQGSPSTRRAAPGPTQDAPLARYLQCRSHMTHRRSHHQQLASTGLSNKRVRPRQARSILDR